MDIDSHCFGDEFGDVFDLGWHFLAVAHAGDVHGAAGVVADNGLRARAGDAGGFVFDDCAADGGIFDGEGSAEAAALVGFFEGFEIDVSDLVEEADAFVFEADAAEVAGKVIGDFLFGGELEGG